MDELKQNHRQDANVRGYKERIKQFKQNRLFEEEDLMVSFYQMQTIKSLHEDDSNK